MPGRRVRTPDALPLRGKLIGITIALLLSSMVFVALATAAAVNVHLVAQTDEELRQLARIVAPMELSDLTSRRTSFPLNFALRVVGDGPTRNLGDAVDAHGFHPDLSELSPASLRSGAPTTVASQEPDGPAWRVLGGPMAGDLTFVVAMPMDDIAATVSAVLARAAGIGLTVAALSGLLGWFAVRRALRPMALIEDTAAAIAAGDRSRRIPEVGSDDEVGSLARSLNTMLVQIEQSRDRAEASESRMRRFVADASHELRTPLVAIRGYAELYRQGALTQPAELAASMRRIEDEAHRMSTLVEDLLMLARLDQEQALELTQTDLAVIAADAVQDARAIDPERPLTLVGRSGRVRPVELRADERRVRQVVTNLVVNALRHTAPGSPIEVVIGKLPGGIALLEVRDHGPGIDPATAEHIFERFYRTDASRNRGTGGTGLGLAIAAAIVAAHRGEITLRPTPGGGATFVVQLPTGGSYLPQRRP